METINIFGASGHGRVIADIILANGLRVSSFYDDVPKIEEINGTPVQHSSELDVKSPLIIGIGLNHIRKIIAERYPEIKYATAIHPTAIVSPTAKIGEGSVVMQGAIIQADTKIGQHVIVNTGASVDHECRIGDYAHISPHATLCGNISVGDLSWIGAGAICLPGVCVGRNCIVGAGSVLNHDVPDNAIVAGNPARLIRYKE